MNRKVVQKNGMLKAGYGASLLGWGILNEVNSFLNAGLETLHGCLDQLLLVAVGISENVVDLLGSGGLSNH